MCIPNQHELDNQKLSRFIRVKQFKNLKNFENSAAYCDNEDEFSDSLAKSTYYTRRVFSYLQDQYKSFQKSSSYKILFGTTQPAHLFTIIAVTILATIVYPHKLKNEPTKLLNFVYLASFCIYFGAQIWMTFISGLSLYFSIPRHHFGNVQRVLFPKYFLLNSILSLTILSIYAKTHNWEDKSSHERLQIAALSLSFSINFLIRVYLTPPMIRLILIKSKIEESAGVGMEIGTLNIGPLKSCPHYLKLHKAFRKVHMSIAIGNIVTMACTVFHLYHLSNKLCIL